MIWGDLINQLRMLHLELMDRFAIQPRAFLQDVELNADDFPFPEATEEFGEWNPPFLPEKIEESIEFHPVERVLMEGPLMPIQEVQLAPPQWDSLYSALLRLEREWLTKTKLHSPEKFEWLEQNLHSRISQLKKRSGAVGLKVV